MSKPADTTSRARRWLSWGPAVLLIGIGFSATGNQALGAWLSIAGIVATGVGLHTFGRSGSDQPQSPAVPHSSS